VIERVGDYEIRDNGQSLHVTTAAGDNVILAMLNRAAERYGTSLNAHGSEDFQFRIARVAGANHLAVSFSDPALEQARRVAEAATQAPPNQAALDYISERNAKRDRISDIPFHRLWQPTDAGQVIFVGLRLVNQQNLLLVRHGPEILVLPVTQQQRQLLARQQREIPLTITPAIVIQTQGLEH
jgi:Large polyvalent protein-associated domain 7